MMLTFQRAVIYPLLDLGLFHQVGGFLGEDELPETRSEPIPVILHHWDAVLWEVNIYSQSGRNIYIIGQRQMKILLFGYLDVFVLDELKHFDVYVFCS